MDRGWRVERPVSSRPALAQLNTHGRLKITRGYPISAQRLPAAAVRAGGVACLRELTAERLERGDLDYYEGGAEDERCVRRNVAALEAAVVWPRVLRAVGEVDAGTELLGRRYACPVGVAPVAMQRLAHPDGERAAAAACARRGALYVLAQQSTTRLEDTAAAAEAAASGAPRWFQAYVFRDRDATAALAARAKAAGCTALVVTVDAPVLGRRERDQRNRFALRKGLKLANVGSTAAQPGAASAAGAQSALAKRIGGRDANLVWEAVPELFDLTGLPVVLKGVVSHDDARRACETRGVAAVWVSNHGGRQLDVSPSTFEALPEVVAGVGGRLPVLFDGGVRRGTDVLKALALGAAFVFVGRPVVYALGASDDGEAGVDRMLAMLENELKSAMALAGARTVADLARHHVQLPGERPPRLAARL
eukprot:PRCOL_00005379-RA